MTLVPTQSHFPNAGPGFDHVTAELVYSIVSKLDDDTAEMYADLLVGELHQNALRDHAELIEKNLGALVDRYGDGMRRGLVRTYVSKRAAGEPVDGLTAAAELISKDFSGAAFTAQARAERARKQHRDLVTGRFVHTHHDLGYDTHDDEGKKLKPASDAQAARIGIPTPKGENGKDLTASQKLAYQQAYAQVAAITAPYRRQPEGKFLHLHYVGQTEPDLQPLPGRGEPLPISPTKRLRSASVSVLPPSSSLDTYDAYGAVRDAVATNYPLGADETGGNPGVRRIRDLNEGVHGGDPFAATGARTMGRVGASAQFLDQSFRNSDGNSVLPKRVQSALRAGQVVGTYGPEAANVIGPHADRTAYRFRGIERPPDRRLETVLESLRRNPNIKSAEDRREIAIHGLETEQGWRPSGILSYFHSRLPSTNLNRLQRRSGTIPPSEGIILDKSGKIATQAVGYGDDHYLPFNLKKLRALRGAEYIRTRTWGGPTTEDIYTGLVGGAKALTVVSHNGVYTIDFDPSFVGSRRYNDKAARMVARYGYLLDAVKNGEITTGSIDPSRIVELQNTAGRQYDPETEPDQYEGEFDRLMARERRNPTLSEAQQSQIASDFLDQEALRQRTPDGHEMTRSELVQDWLTRQGRGDADFTRQIAQRAGLTSTDPRQFNEAAIKAMGLSDRYAQFRERAESTYRDSLRPLELNGPGYDLALQALQEQFPYYIRGVDYHPWTENRNGRDTGYVKPKHTRPAAVQAGYFDEAVNGRGKVRADSIRGQARQAVPFTTARDRAREAARGARETAQGITGRRPTNPDAARELQLQADTDLIRSIQSQTHFGSGLHGAGVPGLEGLSGGRGQEIGPVNDDDFRRISPELHAVRTTPEADLLRGAETPEGSRALHDRLSRALGAVERHNVFELPSDVVGRFRRGGQSETPTRFDRAAVGHNLRNIDSEHDFGQRGYDRGAGRSADELADLYRSDRAVQGATELGLPSELGDWSDAAVENVQRGLEQRQAAALRWEADGRPPALRPANLERLPAHVEGLARAKQLRRRQLEANQAADEAAASAISGVTPSQAGSFTVTGPGGQQFEIGFQGGTPQARGRLQPMSQSDVDQQFNDMTSQF